MININFSNVEKLIFENSDDLKYLLPNHYWSFFEQWKMGKQFPFLKQIGKSATFDFLNHINPTDIEKLEVYFGEKISIEKLYYNTVLNLTIPLSEKEICQRLCEVVNFNYFRTYRDDQYLYISFWK